MEIFIIVGGIAWLLTAALGAWVAVQKRRAESEGLILGILFGPLGVLIEAMLPTGDVMPPPVGTEKVIQNDGAWHRQRLVGLLVMICIMVGAYLASRILAR